MRLLRKLASIGFLLAFTSTASAGDCFPFGWTTLPDLGCYKAFILPFDQHKTEKRAEWSAISGHVTASGNTVTFKFMLDDESMQTLGHQPFGSNFGLEIGIDQETGAPLNLTNVSWDSGLNVGNPVKDMQAFDWLTNASGSTSHAVLVRDAQALQAGIQYEVTFTFSSIPAEGVYMRPSLQIVADRDAIAHLDITQPDSTLDAFTYFVVETDGFYKFIVKPVNSEAVVWSVADNKSGSKVINISDNRLADQLYVSEVCAADDLNWFGKLLVKLRIVSIACGQVPANQVIDVAIDTSLGQAIFSTTEPVFADGQASTIVTFEEAGVTAEEVDTSSSSPPPLNHDHRVSLESVRIMKNGQSNWHYDEAYKGEKNFDIRVKLEEKEGRDANNTCVTIYRSNDKDFSRSGDTKLADTECVDLPANANDSVFFEDLDIPPVGMHYIFADIEPEGYDHNISSAADFDDEGHREYATLYVEPVWADLIIPMVGSVTVPASSDFRIPYTASNIGNAVVTCSVTNNRSEINVNGMWKFVADDATKGVNLDPGVNHPENMAGIAPSTPGTYQVRVQADSTNCVPESDEGNNYGYGTLTVTPPPRPDFRIESVGTASVYPGEQFRIGYYVVNSGTTNGTVDIISRSEVNNGGWKFVADDTTQAANLAVGTRHYEDMAGTAPSTPGTYQVRACADYGNRIVESNEANNCATGTLVVKEPPPPTVTITSPSAGATWKSYNDYDIRWSWSNLPYGEPIRIDYYNYGRWTTIYDGYTTNDGKKRWYMDKNRTKDDHGSRIRIVRRSDGKVLGTSAAFFIDRKKGTPKW